MGAMWTQDKCLARAALLESSADQTADETLRDQYREIARGWRNLATHAQWEDDFNPAKSVLTLH